MTKRAHIVSYQASVETLRIFFSLASDADVVSIENVFAAAKRADRADNQNRSWLSNKLTSLYFHGLVSAIKDENGKIRQLKLTAEGKKALNQHQASANRLPDRDTPPGKEVLTIEQIMDAIPELRKAHPKWDIVFTVNPKEEAPMSDR
jgi:hypothetical protein